MSLMDLGVTMSWVAHSRTESGVVPSVRDQGYTSVLAPRLTFESHTETGTDLVVSQWGVWSVPTSSGRRGGGALAEAAHAGHGQSSKRNLGSRR